MAYRRPHNRRAHVRRNRNGSISFVRGTRVNGHSYTSSNKRRKATSFTSYDSDYTWYILDKLFWLFVAAYFSISLLLE